MAQVSLEGATLTWLDALKEEEGTWSEFKNAFVGRFGRDPEEMIDRLVTMRQHASVDSQMTVPTPLLSVVGPTLWASLSASSLHY